MIAAPTTEATAEPAPVADGDWLTNDLRGASARLVQVIELQPDGRALVEDAMSGKTRILKPAVLGRYRRVVPEPLAEDSDG